MRFVHIALHDTVSLTTNVAKNQCVSSKFTQTVQYYGIGMGKFYIEKYIHIIYYIYTMSCRSFHCLETSNSLSVNQGSTAQSETAQSIR